MSYFKTFNIPDWLICNLEKNGYTKCSPIQDLVIPKALKGQTLIVRSETGSGKTHCFIVPILSSIDPNLNELQAIIVCPTKELARQTYNFIDQLLINSKITAKLVSSSLNDNKVKKSIINKPHIIVGTVGKLKEFFIESSFISTRYINTLVLDEADMLLEDSFKDVVAEFFEKINAKQTMIFSATISQNLQYILETYLKDEFVITSDSQNMTSKNVTHYAINIKHKPIVDSVYDFIKAKNAFCMLIFVSTKDSVPQIYDFLKQKGLLVTYISGDLSKQARKNTINLINDGKYQYVVCSDLAARGLDIKNIDVVLSIDLPNNLEYYYHRAGRTGRFDQIGESYIFYNVDTQKKLLKLKEQGLAFECVQFDSNGEIIKAKSFLEKKVFKNKQNAQLETEISKIKSKSDSKVKPGYKKKYNEQVRKAKSKIRRENIRKEIRKQRVERYKREARNGQ